MLRKLLLSLAAATLVVATTAGAAPGSLHVTTAAGSAPAELFPWCDVTKKAYLLHPDLPAAGEALHGFSTSGLACSGYLQYTFEAPAQLSGDGLIELYTSCSTPILYTPPGTALGQRLIFYHNGEEFTRYEAAAPTTHCTGSSDVILFGGVVGTGDRAFAAGDLLQIQLILWYNGAPDSFVILTGPDSPSRFEAEGLPMPSGGEGGPELPSIFWEDLPDGDASVAKTFAEPTNDVYLYNWTHDYAAVDFEAAVEVTSGTLFLGILDENEEELFFAEVTGTITLNEIIEATPGTWVLAFGGEDFVGSITMTATEAIETPEPTGAGPGGSGSASPSGSSTPSGNGTGNPVQNKASESKDSPGPGALLMVGGILAAAYVAMRRRL